MKSSKFKSRQSTSKRSIKSREQENENPENENPSPLQFDKFIPWFCLQMRGCPFVTVERLIKEDFAFPGSRRINVSRSGSKESTTQPILDDTKKPEISCQYKEDINIKAYYNYRNQLIEVAIIDCSIKINRKVIQAINLCLPFHSYFKKLIIKGMGLTEIVLYEVGKLLPHSNITDVCLDDTYVPEGNYYVLLDKLSQLQYFSLCRCKINDVVCKKIADKLNFEGPGSKTLLALDLTSNRITNLGALHLGCMLRQNRTLLYLNLSDNKIEHTGASYILGSLMLFPLTEGESYELKKRRFRYSARKLEMYKKYEQELLDRLKDEEDKENYTKSRHFRQSRQSRQSRKQSNIFALIHSAVKEQAEKMTIDNIGKFIDVFNDDNVIYRNAKLHCIGNLKLCYLNMAYNDLNCFFLKHLRDVLEYQSNLNVANCKGLLKVIYEGNEMDKELIETVEPYLKLAISKHTRLKELNRSVSFLQRKWK